MPSANEQTRLDQVLLDFVDVLSPDPGRTDAALLSINTGDHAPVRNHPYRILPRWKDEVRLQIDHLLELGIIRPSDSPWSSSIVTVGKKDGGVRICIDFRAINSITQLDPYQMPLIEEILDTSGLSRKSTLIKVFIRSLLYQKTYQRQPFVPRGGSLSLALCPLGSGMVLLCFSASWIRYCTKTKMLLRSILMTSRFLV